MQRWITALLATSLVLIGGCGGQTATQKDDPSPSPAIQPGEGGQGQAPAAKAKKGPADGKALLDPEQARPGMMHIRREGNDYTLELLLDTSSSNTVYDIELPD
jgi:hypothetical protein